MRDGALPPLAALRAFEAAARHGSFTKAGEELGMTQAAVSYQIKVIEDRVGTPLFVRRPRQVVLTETGRRLAPAVSDAFERLAAAYAEARGTMQTTLTISVAQTFATNWLVQNLGAFQMLHPMLAVRLEATQHMVDFQTEDVDAAIRGGHGQWTGLAMHKLLEANFSPMLSPRLAETIGGITRPEDLLRLPLVEPGDPWWNQWFAAAGVVTDSTSGPPSPRLGGPDSCRARGRRRPRRGDPDPGALSRRGRAGPARPTIRPDLHGRARLLAGLPRGAPQRAENPRLPRMDYQRRRRI